MNRNYFNILSMKSFIVVVVFSFLCVSKTKAQTLVLATGAKATTFERFNNFSFIPAISGTSSICIGSTTTLTDTVGGKWTSADTSIAKVDSLSGVVMGIHVGTVTISFTYDTFTAVTTITVDTFPNAGIITGDTVVCVGSSITLTESVSGGIWTATDTNANITAGVVNGISAGMDSIIYTVNNSCGAATASMHITINPLPFADSIHGTQVICMGTAVNMYDSTLGGIWSVGIGNVSIDSIGVVNGVSTGLDTIKYSVTNTCGTAISTLLVNVNPLPIAGTITGTSTSVCAGSTITLADAAGGGSWSAANSNAAIDSVGIVTGVTEGTDSIIYTVSTVCGSADTALLVTINPQPVAGFISALLPVCIGHPTTLTSTASGGVWSASNGNATVDSIGILTGTTAGIDTISYSVTNICNTAIATIIITVNPLPDDGTIVGLSSICVGGTSVALSDIAPGGTWSATNLNATVSDGIVVGNTPGIDTINYSVTNICGTAVATLEFTVMTVPDPGIVYSVIDSYSLCVGANLILTDTVVGGIWSEVTGLTTVTAGVVLAVNPGIDTINYTVSNVCGSATAGAAIIINPLPDAGVIIGSSVACSLSVTTLYDASSGGTWSSSSILNAVVFGGLVFGLTPGAAVISYSVSNSCGTAVATKNITVYPMPTVGAITGPQVVCIGSTITLSDPTPGGFWFEKYGTTLVTDSLVTGLTVGIDSIIYIAGNACGSVQAGVQVTINPIPVPIITAMGDVLSTSSAYSSYQWYKNGVIITGATNASYLAVDTGNYTVQIVDIYGCIGSSSVYHVIKLSVANINSNENGITIFPNPTNALINIEAKHLVDIRLSTIDGRFIMDAKEVKQLDISNLPDGVYIVYVFDNNTGIKLTTTRITKTGK